ncbi:hypothetical protein tb265_25070 [Gemmatimonadetes bacterium T265]|nr:hypothetical protein tb265_25070 [Gemmatimonadetes bacterium T265]
MSKETSKRAATKASSVMTSGETGAKSKSAAGSALSQTGAPKKVTSPTVAKKASAALRDGRSSTATKTAAGSALAQARSKKRK